MIRLYIGQQIGTGTYLDPYRSILNNFIDITKGDTFDSICSLSSKFSICLLNAGQAAHDAAVAYKAVNPGTIIYLSSLHADMVGLRAQYAQIWSSLPLTFRSVAENFLTAHGIADFTGTIKDVLKRLIVKYSMNSGIIPFGGDNF